MTPSDAEARVRAAWPGARTYKQEWWPWHFRVKAGGRTYDAPTLKAAWEAAASRLPSDPRALVLSAHPAAFVRRTSDGWHVFASAVRLLGSAATEAGAWGEAARGLGTGTTKEQSR